MKQITQWFPIEVKPIRKGWYHIRWKEDESESEFNWWWDGVNFSCSKNNNSWKVTNDVMEWRGLKDHE